MSDMYSFDKPWYYKNGVYNGRFGRVLGQGANGVVIEGTFEGKEAAFKFVRTKWQKPHQYSKDINAFLDAQITEMSSITSTKGSRILTFLGHYR